MIRQLENEDLDRAFQIITDCRNYMYSIGIPQWTEHYPTLETIQKDIGKKEAFGYFHEKILAGIIIINDHQDVQYLEINWKFKDGKIGVIHRLAVDPKFQKMGIAAALMVHAEKYFKENLYASIRLDAFSMNEIALKMYDNLNYQRRGEVYFPFRERSFWCFEKKISID